MIERKEALENIIEDWTQIGKEKKQFDDMLVMGIALPQKIFAQEGFL